MFSALPHAQACGKDIIVVAPDTMGGQGLRWQPIFGFEPIHVLIIMCHAKHVIHQEMGVSLCAKLAIRGNVS